MGLPRLVYSVFILTRDKLYIKVSSLPRALGHLPSILGHKARFTRLFLRYLDFGHFYKESFDFTSKFFFTMNQTPRNIWREGNLVASSPSKGGWLLHPLSASLQNWEVVVIRVKWRQTLASFSDSLMKAVPFTCLHALLLLLYTTLGVFLYSCLPVFLSSSLPVFLSSCVPVFLSSCLPVFLSSSLAVMLLLPHQVLGHPGDLSAPQSTATQHWDLVIRAKVNEVRTYYITWVTLDLILFLGSLVLQNLWCRESPRQNNWKIPPSVQNIFLTLFHHGPKPALCNQRKKERSKNRWFHGSCRNTIWFKPVPYYPEEDKRFKKLARNTKIYEIRQSIQGTNCHEKDG